ncbi:hypothetical protein GTN66_04935 [bacterium]|nr:hypothetical protein [bacterium]NIN91611.1 hypothetical protein [bacterium]NIO17975.1 hypothetical protein [bacterium]NIO73743.1 hypothetical protein [bacterium]
MEKINRRVSIVGLCILFIVILAGFVGAQPTITISDYIEIKDTSVFDSAGKERTTYSSSEKIGFSVTCYNPQPVDRIYFEFYVYNAQGAQVFKHTGNSAEGKVGTGSSSIRNIPISQFYRSPGKYFYMAKVIAGSSTGSPEASNYMVFYVYSPAITLSYPANGARDLIDKPLTFRWVSSGATKYRVYVDDDKGFYNTLFQTGKGEYPDPVTTYFQYPTSPKDPRQKLAGGVVYWWKVEGLDSQGNVVAKTPVPFSFTLKETVPSVTTKDLAVTDIILDEQSTAGGLKFDVLVKNQGGMAISNTRVNLYVNGVPVIPFQLLDFINTGEEGTLTFVGEAVEEKMVTVSAALDFPDDNIKNNMLTKVFTLARERKRYEPGEAWRIIKTFIRDLEILKELEGYTLSEVTLFPRGDIDEQLEKLDQGKAKVVGVEIEVVK